MRYWYFPLSIKYFDFIKAFHRDDTIDVRMFSNFKFKVGDVVFIYSGEPYSQFLYLTEITKTDIPFNEADLQAEYRADEPKPTVNNWMRLEIRKAVPVGTHSLQSAYMRGMGFYYGRSPHLIKDPDIVKYLTEEFNKNHFE